MILLAKKIKYWSTKQMTLSFLAILVLLPISLLAQAATITVGPSDCDFSSIGEAVQEAKAGDFIQVRNGTYQERVVLDKTIRLEGVDRPVVDAGGKESAITVISNGTVIKGFVLTNSGTGGAGIKIRSNENMVEGNLILENRWYGVMLDGASNNVVKNNNISNNKYGIWIAFNSNKNEIYGNDLLYNNNYDAIDSGVNDWDKNLYSDFAGSKLEYNIPGGINVDKNPRAPEPEPELPVTASPIISVKITIPAPIVE